MADSAYAPGLANASIFSRRWRHSPLVRITHWIQTAGFFALLVSGVNIILAHPRLYWGETGNIDTPSLIDLPLPFVLAGQTGWARYLHFLTAWVCVATGLVYVVSGVLTQHFRKGMVTYNPIQRLTYLGAIFVLFPLIALTGLAMSPAITSVFPELVEVFGGQQSARTIHFFAASLLAAFFIVHVVMVWRAGFIARTTAMITGQERI